MNASVATIQATHTPGPWKAIIGENQPSPFYAGLVALTQYSPDKFAAVVTGDGTRSTKDRWEANARLIAAGPAQDLILKMCELGVARLEICSHEFCFNGLRYSIGEQRDWNLILNVIGWDVARTAVRKARGVQ